MAWTVESAKTRKTHLDALPIRDVSPTRGKFSIIGIIISKLPIRKFVKNENGKKSTQAVLTFTIRDSLFDWINGSFWGLFTNVTTVASGFNIGDCVLVVGARAKSKVKGSYEDQFMVSTPTEFHLVLSDLGGNIVQFNFPDKTYTANLKSALTVPTTQHMSLNQIVQVVHARNETYNVFQRCERQANPQSRPSSGQFTFFAAVAEVGQPKAVILRRKRIQTSEVDLQQDEDHQSRVDNFAEVAQRCELVLFDETCARFPLTLWNDEWIHTAFTTFIPYVTVLSIIDCPVRYDDYRRGVVAVPNSKTLIIVAPECSEANRLSQYAKHRAKSPRNASGFDPDKDRERDIRFTQPLPSLLKRAPPEVYDIPLTSIHNIMTIRELKSGKTNTGYGIVFALITKIDLDRTDLTGLVTLQCNSCQRRMLPCDPPADLTIPAPGKPVIGDQADGSFYAMCTTNDCPLANQRFAWSDTQHIMLDYGTMINLSDHTGTYHRTLLGGKAMTNLTGCPPTKFITLDLRQRSRIKWNICLHRFKIYFWSEQPSFNCPFPVLTVLACEKPNAFEVMNSLQNHLPGHC
ncbi:Meiosis-specific with OB domain-containing protein [Paragonimus kellicotti]|nr:Meiosis-specific with OB domain-containing protein [Paragonimus kellicotti]